MYEQAWSTEWTAAEWDEIAWSSLLVSQLIFDWSVDEVRGAFPFYLDGRYADVSVEFEVKSELLNSVFKWRSMAQRIDMRDRLENYPRDLAMDLLLPPVSKLVQGAFNVRSVIGELIDAGLEGYSSGSTLWGERSRSTIAWNCGVHPEEGWFCVPVRN